MQAIADHPNVAVKSCHSAGKSFTAAQVVVWWLDAHPPGTAFVVTSAPTGDQVKAILWREIGRAHKKAGLPGRTNLTEWYDESGELVGFGRKPNDYEPTAFQGIHAQFVLVVLDEACGIPEMLWDAASTLASNENSRVFAIGNPDDPQSHFAKVCKSAHWKVITISAYDTPNFTGEEVHPFLNDVLVSQRWVEEKADGWGRDSPLFISKVLGEFPEDATDGVIPFSWAATAQLTELKADGPRELGFDVSGGGVDRAVIWLRDGPVAVQKWTKQGEKDPEQLAYWARDIIRETGSERIKVDSIGVGWGICGTLDVLRGLGTHNAEVVPVNVSTGPTDDEDGEFLNLRAQLWWMGRELSREKKWDLTHVSDDDVHELTCPRYHTNNPRAKIQVEKKSDVKKRLGLSPDSADALLLAFYDPYGKTEYWTDIISQMNILT